jgi:hypothetical protein
MGLGQMTSNSIIHMDLHNPNNKLISAESKHFWCMDEPCVNIDSWDSPWPKVGGSHYLPPFSILYAWPHGQHSNVILSRDSQVRILKFLKLGLP